MMGMSCVDYKVTHKRIGIPALCVGVGLHFDLLRSEETVYRMPVFGNVGIVPVVYHIYYPIQRLSYARMERCFSFKVK